MSSYSQGLFSLLLIVSLSMPLIGQNSNPKLPATETGRDRVLTPFQQRALGLLDQLSDKAKEFREDEARIRVKVRVADLLWDYDQARARRQFEETFHEIRSATIGSSLNKQPSASDINDLRAKLHEDVLPLIARRDRALAVKLIKSLTDTLEAAKEASNESKSKGEAQHEQTAQYLWLAQNLAKTDPQIAAQMVIEGLNGNTIPSIIPILKVIREQNQMLADEIFGQTLSVARNSSNGQWYDLSRYIFPNLFGDWADLNIIMPNSSPNGASSTSSFALVAQFLNYAYDAILRDASQLIARGAPRNDVGIFYFYAQPMLLLFDQYQPNQAAILRAKIGELFRYIPGEKNDFWLNAYRPHNTKDFLDEAEKAQTQAEKDKDYINAVLAAIQEGDVDRAISIINKISNESRSGLESLVRYRASLRAIDKGDVDEAYKQGKEITDLQPRARIFSKISLLLYKKKDLVRAIEMLNQAEQSISQGDNGLDKVNAMLMITETAATIDYIQGFEMMDSVVSIINQSYFKLNVTNSMSKPNIWVRAIGSESINVGWLNFDDSFAVLARVDFDRALLLAQSLERKEMATLAQLAVCRGALAKSSESQPEAKKPKQTALGQAILF